MLVSVRYLKLFPEEKKKEKKSRNALCEIQKIFLRSIAREMQGCSPGQLPLSDGVYCPR